MKVLVVGESGFVGRNVVAMLLESGCEVAVFGREPHAWLDVLGVPTLVGDRRQLAAHAHDVRAFAPDVVVDLILASGRQAEDLTQVVRGVARRIVVASSIPACQFTNRDRAAAHHGVP